MNWKGKRKVSDVPVNAISLPCWRWPVIEDMSQMSVTDSTEGLGPRHEEDRHIKFVLDIVTNRLIIGRPSSAAIKLGR
jgi:hypothetical protein